MWSAFCVFGLEFEVGADSEVILVRQQLLLLQRDMSSTVWRLSHLLNKYLLSSYSVSGLDEQDKQSSRL